MKTEITDETTDTVEHETDFVESTLAHSVGFALESELERRIAAEPRWRAGLDWGVPRPGHPEGTIRAHIRHVLENVQRFYPACPHRADLRVITLIHDTFKGEVDETRSCSGGNHHAMIARRFAEALIDDLRLLDVIELHDEAFNAWRRGARDGRWDAAERRGDALLARLGENLPLYVAFYRCDNATEGKDQESFEWFLEFASRRGHAV